MILAGHASEAHTLAVDDLWLVIGAYATVLLALIAVGAWLKRVIDSEVKRALGAAVTTEVAAQTAMLREQVMGDGQPALREQIAALRQEQASHIERVAAVQGVVDGVSRRLDTFRGEYMHFLEEHFGRKA